jgi:tRNA (guanine37-N1)-methyltransferase
LRERVSLALVHYPTLDRTGAVVASAVTMLDLHDLARLSTTYGLGGVYVATPLEGQRALSRRLLSHWIDGRGGEANPCRREALATVQVVEHLADAVEDLEGRWGLPPQLVATSARAGADRRVGFGEARERIRGALAPVVLVFGTGWGLAAEALADCEWVLEPIRGAGSYNHLSVRSAASIIVDRLFGER